MAVLPMIERRLVSRASSLSARNHPTPRTSTCHISIRALSSQRLNPQAVAQSTQRSSNLSASRWQLYPVRTFSSSPSRQGTHSLEELYDEAKSSYEIAEDSAENNYSCAADDRVAALESLKNMMEEMEKTRLDGEERQVWVGKVEELLEAEVRLRGTGAGDGAGDGGV